MLTLKPEVVEARRYRDGVVPPSSQLRELRMFHPHAREGQRLYYAGRWWVYEIGDWWHWKPAPQITREQMGQALSSSRAARLKHEAAPDWSEFIALWGEGGCVRNERGQVVGYRYPQHDDPEKAARVKRQVLELWKKHMDLSTDIGLEESAKHEPVTLVDRSTGATTTAHPLTAEKKAKKMGLVEARKRRVRATHGRKGGKR